MRWTQVTSAFQIVRRSLKLNHCLLTVLWILQASEGLDFLGGRLGAKTVVLLACSVVRSLLEIAIEIWTPALYPLRL